MQAQEVVPLAKGFTSTPSPVPHVPASNSKSQRLEIVRFALDGGYLRRLAKLVLLRLTLICQVCLAMLVHLAPSVLLIWCPVRHLPTILPLPPLPQFPPFYLLLLVLPFLSSSLAFFAAVVVVSCF